VDFLNGLSYLELHTNTDSTQGGGAFKLGGKVFWGSDGFVTNLHEFHLNELALIQHMTQTSTITSATN
jgi:hypothetical protein